MDSAAWIEHAIFGAQKVSWNAMAHAGICKRIVIIAVHAA
tara:strand:+ start:263 stop:382 length:120 start_codon:yes stop_codon:yes gene_type:complete